MKRKFYVWSGRVSLVQAADHPRDAVEKFVAHAIHWDRTDRLGEEMFVGERGFSDPIFSERTARYAWLIGG